MDRTRFEAITGCYSKLSIAVLGDFCLDRYLEIDPGRQEVSIETGLPVYNVVKVRAQPGGAGTILNNLAALGISTIYPIGFTGVDGEGFELHRALENLPGVRLEHVLQTPHRRTFTYCKPLLVRAGQPPVELNRLDSKNWAPTPAAVEEALVRSLLEACRHVDALIVLEQADVPETGVVTQTVLKAVGTILEQRGHPSGPGTKNGDAVESVPAEMGTGLPILADSRRGLRGYPPAIFKMNAAELASLTGATASDLTLDEIRAAARHLAATNGRTVFVTLAERGILGAMPSGQIEHIGALPVRGEIDVVGAGDAVSANLAAGLAAGASVRESLELANAAASVVLHKLGTTGTANPAEIRAGLGL